MAIQERNYDYRPNALKAFEHVIQLSHDESRTICHCPTCLRQAEALAQGYVDRLVPAIEAVGMKDVHYPKVVISQGNAKLKIPAAFFDLVTALKKGEL